MWKSIDERLRACNGTENPVFNLDRLDSPGVQTVVDRAATIRQKQAFVIQVNGAAQGGVYTNVNRIPTQSQVSDPLALKHTMELARNKRTAC